MTSLIIAGIHTGIGKTLCSAIICQAKGWDYWKPVQAGDTDSTDSDVIKKSVTNNSCHVHPETYLLQTAASPHYAAAVDGIEIKPAQFTIPVTNNGLVIETAGGVMSPLAINFLNIDLAAQLQLPVILVSSYYLGSINHTLLSVAALRQRNIPIAGLVFNGTKVDSTHDFILEYTDLPLLFSIPQMENANASSIATFAAGIDINF
jgi:dethiobiotin synthetase